MNRDRLECGLMLQKARWERSDRLNRRFALLLVPLATAGLVLAWNIILRSL